MALVEVRFEYEMFDSLQLKLPMIPEINSNFILDKKLLTSKKSSKCSTDTFYVRSIDYLVGEDYSIKVVVNLYSRVISM